MARITRDNLVRDMRTQHGAPSVPDDGLTPEQWAGTREVGPWTRYHGLLLWGGASNRQLREHALAVAEMAASHEYVSPRTLLQLAASGIAVDALASLVQWRSYDHAMRAIVASALDDVVQAADSAVLHAVAACVGDDTLERAIADLARRCSGAS